MLQQLSIKNYALIDELEVDFPKQLSIITGETGAGKSILLGALGLIVGNRADSQSLQDKTKKCIVEAFFEIENYHLQSFFKENDLDYENITSIRREVSPEGKSRAFINDTPVTLNQLKELGEYLIDIHSQHQTLKINGSEFQLSVVDTIANNETLLLEYQTEFKTYKALENKLSELIEKEIQAKKELDYFQFQFDELDNANLKPNEQGQLEEELETLNNSEEIKSTLVKASQSLNDGEQNIISSLKEIKTTLSSIAKFNKNIDELNERLNSSLIELKDISDEIESLNQEIIYDPKRIELLTDKLDEIYRLQQKHQVKSIEELFIIKEQLSNKLIEFNSLESEILKTKAETDKINKSLTLKAKQLSENRKKNIPKIEKEVTKILSSLSMVNAQLKINHSVFEKLTVTGFDQINFLFSANKGSEFKDLNKVASGGELSRLMLALKSLIAELTALPTIIFDEIDTGVSGDVADKVGIIMSTMAKKMQVITITHLPQIASKGNSHLFVYKEEKNNKTYSNIKALTKEERVQEIAKMLSTSNPSAAAMSNAKELLKS